MSEKHINIPDKLKVGGSTYTITKTDNLKLGQNYQGECFCGELAINIRPASQEVMEVVFLHEIVHAIYSNLGYFDHDEKKIEELARSLHMIIVDNPEMFGSQEAPKKYYQSTSLDGEEKKYKRGE